LASYGESFYMIGRLSARHVQRVLLGTDPGVLPLEQLVEPRGAADRALAPAAAPWRQTDNGKRRQHASI
jgi:hypothetical protein